MVARTADKTVDKWQNSFDRHAVEKTADLPTETIEVGELLGLPE
jgi:hypothetical protein